MNPSEKSPSVSGVTRIATTFPLTGGIITSSGTIGLAAASPNANGYLSSSDWSSFNGKQDPITLTTIGTSGPATFINDVLNIPQYSGGSLTLTTIGTSGAATLIGNVLNIPQYTDGITSLNTLTSTTQTFATGTTGTDFNISSAASTHTFNIPDAGASARGVVTTGTQTLAGDKTFSSAPTFSTMTAGSLLFAGTSGLLSQDNTNLFWDNTNKRLGIGTNAPTQKLRVIGDGAFLHTTTLSTGSGGSLATFLTISPTSTSAAGHRGFSSQNNHNAVGINFTGFNTTAGWFENRPINAGTINELFGIYSTGLLLGGNSITCGNVARTAGAYIQAINQFNTNSIVLNVVDAFGIVVQGPNRITCTNTNYAAISINPQSAATNNTGLLLGTTSIPSGNWGIYQNDSANNYMNGKLFIGTTVDAGYKLDVNGIARVVTSLDTPLVRGSSSIASGTLTLSSTGSVTKGRIIFGSSTYFFDEVNNSLKLGNVLPPLDNIAFRVQVTSEASNANYVATTFSNTAAESAGINFARYRGTAASPLAVQSGDRLGLVVSLGYDGSARQASSAILFSCDGAVTSGVMPSAVEFQTGTSGAGRTTRLTISSAGNFTYFDGGNFILGTTTGTKIGTATSQKLSFWNATPIVQPTTAVAAATRVGGGGTTVTDTDTFDGYTIAQIVKALRNAGLLA